MLKKFFIRLSKINELVLILLVLIIAVITGTINPSFYSPDNIINILRTTSYVVIVAAPCTMLLIMAGLDLSTGSVLGLSGMIAALSLVTFNLPTWLAVLCGICLGALFGLLNGLMVVKFKIPAMIVTLGSLYIARGIMNVLTEGKAVYPLTDEFNNIGSGLILSLPYSIYIAILIVIIVFFVLKHTVYGRYIHAIGGNEDAAKTSGLNVDLIKISVYCLTSIGAAISGVIMTARMASAQISTGQGWELSIIASVIIGGTSLFGGTGSVFGTVVGALLMTMLTNAMIVIRVSAYWQSIVVGVIIILAVGIDQYKRRKSGEII